MPPSSVQLTLLLPRAAHAGEEHQPGALWELLCEMYCVDDKGFTLPGIKNAVALFATALGHGNITARINDPLIDPLGLSERTTADAKEEEFSKDSNKVARGSVQVGGADR
jgi:hypothetical protein